MSAKILVVEDERIVALDLAHGLEHLGYEVVGMVASAADAVRMAREHRPDVVLMDIHLDGAIDGTVAGREILEQLRIPVVYLTAYAEPETQARAEASRPLHEQQQRQANAVFQTMAEGIAILDHDGLITSVNPAFTTLTGHAAEAVLGRHPDDFLHLRGHSADFYRLLDDAPVAYWQGEIDIRRADAITFPAWQHVCPVRDQAGQVTHYVLTFSDISLIRSAEAHIHHLAFHDALTGLGNRHMLRGRLEEEIHRASRTGRPLALLFVDLDNFKFINDAHGHAAGDALISTVAQRVTAHLRGSDLAVRLGGDQFVIIVPDLPRIEDAALIAEKLLEGIHQPLIVKGETIQVGACVGIAIHPDDGDNAEALMQSADSAMYVAKARGRHRYAYFSADMAETTRERLQVEQGLRRALEQQPQRHELQLEFQPVVNLAAGQITGAEALVRWDHPQWGRVGPTRFIQIAEDSGLIVPLGLWVLREACRQGVSWLAAGAPPLRLAVNVSVRQMQNDHFVEDVAQVLRETGFPPQQLELEITESTLQSMADSRSMLGRFRHLGVKMALDDFGTGFSSLSLLKHLAIDRIKIDRSFVIDLPGAPLDEQITHAIVHLASALRLQMTAEGVETEAQRSSLMDMGCLEGQGYLFSQPLSGGNFHALRASAAPMSLH
ncbi:MAG: putative bifunctional diguanylate cyclase/phosphodiesterase [Leptothrix sp. (in: b-proteobacteria)]